MRWSKEELSYLKENYEFKSNIELSNHLGRTLDSIYNIATKMKLKKSPIIKSQLMILRNKKMGRDLNVDNIKKIALMYKSRSEFQYKDHSAYAAARRHGILEDVCSHMNCLNFSVPQMILKKLVESLISKNIKYDDRKTIKPYEIDIFLPDYNIAFEYDGKRWHTSNKNDNIKNSMMFSLGIHLFRFNENSRKYEEDIKRQFISILDKINSITGLNLCNKDILSVDVSIIYDEIINERNIKEICLRYTDFSIFRKCENKVYKYLLKSKLMIDYTSHMYRGRKPIVESDVVTLISKYTYLCDLIKENRKFYTWIKKHQKEYLLKDLILKQNKKLKCIFL